MKVDLLVAGAGPAGCAAAAAALRRAPSLRVAVVDAASFPRDKLCAGAITGGGLREMELAGLRLRVRHAIAEHAVVRLEGQSRRIWLPRPSVVVRRREWDADLLAQIRSAGATVFEGCPLSAFRQEGEGGVAQAGPHRISYRLAVAADGAAGPSRRLLGMPVGRRVPLRELAVEGESRQELLFDLDAGVAGYAWHFPRGFGEGSTGIYSVESAADLSGHLLAWMDREPGRRVFRGKDRSAKPQAGSARLFDPKGPIGRGPVVLAGEALGVDPLAGEGIRYALWSGRIAGDLAAILVAQGLPPAVTALGFRLAYRLRLTATRSGAALALGARLAPLLYQPRFGERFRRMAADREVAEALAALISGSAPARPVLRLAMRYLRLSAESRRDVAARSIRA